MPVRRARNQQLQRRGGAGSYQNKTEDNGATAAASAASSSTNNSNSNLPEWMIPFLSDTKQRDTFHNHDFPCCLLLQGISQQVFAVLPNEVSSSSSCSPKQQNGKDDSSFGLLHALLRQYEEEEKVKQSNNLTAAATTASAFITSESVGSPDEFIVYHLLRPHLQRPNNNNHEWTSGDQLSNITKSSKKKRKKKKKKSLVQSSTTAPSDYDDEDEVEELDNSKNNNAYQTGRVEENGKSSGNSDYHDSGEQEETIVRTAAGYSPSLIGDFREENSLTMSSGVNISGYQSTDDDNAKHGNNPQLIMTKEKPWHLEDFLARVAAKVVETAEATEKTAAPNSSSGTSNASFAGTRTRLDEFWHRVVQKANQAGGCILSPVQVGKVVDTIECPVCQEQVRQVLEIETSLPLKRLGMTATKSDKGFHGSTSNMLLPDGSSTGVIQYEQYSNAENHAASAFDYVAMEEGKSPPIMSMGQSSLSPESVSTGGLAFELVPLDNVSSPVWQLRRTDRQPWTIHDIDVLLYDYYLGRGLPQDDVLGISTIRPWPPEAYHLVRDRVAAKCHGIAHELSNLLDKEFHALTQSLLHTVRQANLAASSSSPTSLSSSLNGDHHSPYNAMEIDAKTFPALKRCDDKCGLILERCVRLVLGLTKPFFLTLAGTAIPSSSVSQHQQEYIIRQQRQLQQRVSDMWKIYLDGIQACVNHEVEYEQKMLRMANPRTGLLPAHYFSAASRRYYVELIHGKISAIRLVADLLCDVFDAPVESGILDHGHHSRHDEALTCHDRSGGSTQMKVASKIIFWNEYQSTMAQFKENHHRGPLNTNSTWLPLDEACQNFFVTLRESMDTVFRGSIDKVLQEHQRRRDQLGRLVAVALAQMDDVMERCRGTAISDANSKPAYESLQKELETIRQKLTAQFNGGDAHSEFVDVESGDISGQDQEAVLAKLNIFRSQLKDGSGLLLDLWMKIGHFYRSHVEKSGEPLALIPMKMLTDQVKETRQSCHGVSGENRAICILVGFVYRWLADICDEWRAELAEQELLTSVANSDQDDFAAAIYAAGSGKSAPNKSKKSKKKKLNARALNGEASAVSDVKSDSSTRDENAPASPPSDVAEITKDNVVGEFPACAKSNTKIRENCSESDEKKDDHTGAETQQDDSRQTKRKSNRHFSIPASESDIEASDSENLHFSSPLDQLIFIEQSDKSNAAEPLSTVDESLVDDDQNDMEPLELSNEHLDSFVTMGVFDANDFTSAEEFLVGRLRAIMNSQQK